MKSKVIDGRKLGPDRSRRPGMDLCILTLAALLLLLWSVTVEAVQVTHVYDNDDRLTKTTVGYGEYQTIIQYVYDNAGNLTSVSTQAPTDSDGDGLADAWEQRYFGNLSRDGQADTDGDGLTDYQEYLAGTNPNSADTDGDGMTDAWELAHGLNPLVDDRFGDLDGDGQTNWQEFQCGADPNDAVSRCFVPTKLPFLQVLIGTGDEDEDGMPDTWEIANGLNPKVNDANLDPDGDGLTNLQEYRLGTNPQVTDTDGDGMPDGWEYRYGLNPKVNDCNEDPDGDGLTNCTEYQLKTNPKVWNIRPGGLPWFILLQN